MSGEDTGDEGKGKGFSSPTPPQLLPSLLALVLPRLPRLSACTQYACRSTILREEALELRKIL